MSQIESMNPHQEDEKKVLQFAERRLLMSHPEDLGTDPLEDLLTEFDHLEDDFIEQEESQCSLSLIEQKMQNLELMTLSEKASLLKEIIQRSHFYMSDLEFYLDKSN